LIARVLFVSTPVGRLGTGAGGGVELTLYNLAKTLKERAIEVVTIAPSGSVLDDLPLIPVSGNLQISAQTQGRDAPIILPENSLLANMWGRARQMQEEYDLILNFAYDWLPVYLTPFFRRPPAHLISMASVSEAMDQIVRQTYRTFPRQFAFHSLAQAETFGIAPPYRCLGNGIELSRYRFRPEAGGDLAWVGRIAPEKALEDALAAVAITGATLRIFGAMPDEAYWRSLLAQYPTARVDYRGFLATERLQAELGECGGLLMTPRWVEAFGNVAIEALACGVPVISYRRGGPAEIIEDGKTGFLVEPDSIEALVTAIGKLDRLDRSACRQAVARQYSCTAFGDRVMEWFTEILAS
jgi:UDP-glucose:tetrahydrobiopterin glucosyltransferase